MKISVVVPALNEENYIEKCLKSLNNQSFPRSEYEIIVVDDASEDNTAKIARKLADKVLVIERVPVGGVRDAGLRAAKAPIVAFTDADTQVPENWLEKIIENFEEKDVVAIYGSLEFDLNSMKEIVDSFYQSALKTISDLGFIHPIGANLALRKDAAIKIGGFRKELKILEEYDLVQRMKEHGNIVHDSKLTVKTSARRIRNIKSTLPYFFSWINYFGKGTTKDVKFEEVR